MKAVHTMAISKLVSPTVQTAGDFPLMWLEAPFSKSGDTIATIQNYLFTPLFCIGGVSSCVMPPCSFFLPSVSSSALRTARRAVFA